MTATEIDEIIDITSIEVDLFTLPDHTQLPETDNRIVENFQEHPQGMLLTETITPVVQRVHPDGQYAIGHDSGIYWDLSAARSETPIRGAISPDWFYVPNVPPLLQEKVRRSYVLWKELVVPLIVLEFVSGSGAEERDRTAMSGKFWIYERMIRPRYYGIYEVEKASVELYRMDDERYRLLPANRRGHYPISELKVELGIWQGQYLNMTLPWLRWWNARGNLLLTGPERVAQEQQRAEQERQRAEQEHQRAEQEHQRAEQERQRAEKMEAMLRSMGVDPEQEG
jgi:Uma2 family endonuclease